MLGTPFGFLTAASSTLFDGFTDDQNNRTGSSLKSIPIHQSLEASSVLALSRQNDLALGCHFHLARFRSQTDYSNHNRLSLTQKSDSTDLIPFSNHLSSEVFSIQSAQHYHLI